MNPFAGLKFETPQQVQQRLQSQRQQAWSSGNPYAMQQATMQNFLDTAFGNPEQMQAERVQKALTGADQSITPQEGDTDIDTQLRRIRAMRDAVANDSPEVASQLNTQMLQLGQIKLEQDKLLAEERRAKSKESREEAEEARNAALFPITIAQKIGDVNAQAGDSYNWIDPATGKMANVPKSDHIQNQAMRERGWVRAGNPTLQGSKDDITGLTKPVVTDLQTNIVESAKQLDSFASIAQKFRPEFLTIPTQAIQWANTNFEKVTGKSVSPEIAAQAQQYQEWRAQTKQALSAYIKSVTGAQAAVAEYDRIEKSFPNDSMSPTQYIGAMRASVKNVIGISKRSQQALAQGLTVTPEMQEACKNGQPCIWDSITTPPVDDTEVDAFLQRFGIPPRMTSQPVEAPGNGGEWMNMPNGARVRVKK